MVVPWRGGGARGVGCGAGDCIRFKRVEGLFQFRPNDRTGSFAESGFEPDRRCLRHGDRRINRGELAARLQSFAHGAHRRPKACMRKHISSSFMLASVFAFFFSAGLVDAQDGAAILKKVDANLQPESFESYRKLINIEPSGAKREFLLYTLKKGNDKIVSLFLSPASEKGRATLRLGENMWLYIPNVGKPVRITSLQSVVGGVFNNSDILQLDYSEEYNVTQVEDQGKEYILLLKAKTKTVAYDQLKMWVDKEKVSPTKIECLTEASMLIKTLYFKDTKDMGGGIVRPSVIETDSPLYKGYKSVMILAKIKKREFKDEVFTLTFMPNLESLR